MFDTHKRDKYLPVLSQKQDISPSESINGLSKIVYAVPLVPRLIVTIPGSIFPVPMAPYILSPEPESTLHFGSKPYSFTSSLDM